MMLHGADLHNTHITWLKAHLEWQALCKSHITGIVFCKSLREPMNSANLGNWHKSKKHCTCSQNALCSLKFPDEIIGKKKNNDKNKEESRSSTELGQLLKKARRVHGKIERNNDPTSILDSLW